MKERNGLRFGGRGGFGSYKHYEQIKKSRRNRDRMKQTETMEISIDCGNERRGRGNIARHKVCIVAELHNIQEPFRGRALEAVREFEETLKNIFEGYPAPECAPYELKTKAVWDAEAGHPKRVPIDET